MTDATDDESPTPDEQRLLDELGGALPDDPPPAGLHERADQLVALVDVERELAELLARPAEMAGMRGGDGGAALTFGTADGEVAVDVTVDRASIAGQVLAGALVAVGLATRAGVLAVARPDGLGRFAFAAVPPGPARLTLQDATSREVVTDWFTI